jgi:hypothetical protein
VNKTVGNELHPPSGRKSASDRSGGPEIADLIWTDGKVVPWDDARVHLISNTLHYGFGVFEGIRCY